MFDYIRKSFGLVSVSEEGDMVTVSGVPGLEIMSDFTRYWKTSKITDYMFTHMGRNSVRFHIFYLPDILYAIDTIVATGKKKYASIRSLSLMKDALLTDTKFKTIVDTNKPEIPYHKLKDLKLTPLEYQSNFYEDYFNNKYKYHLNGYLLAATAGGGKTNTALTTYYLTGKKQCIVICPFNAIDTVWIDHIKNKTFKHQKKYSSVLDPKLDLNAEFIIIHYEYLKEFVNKHMSHFRGSDTAIILDESHNFNELDSMRTELYLNLCNSINSDDIIHLSGTPIKALPIEAIPLLRAIVPDFTKDVQDSFKKIYRQNNNRGTDILANRLGLVSFKVTKEDVGIDKPNIQTKKIKMPTGSKYTLDSIKVLMTKYIEERSDYYRERHSRDQELFYKGLTIYRDAVSDNKTLKKEYESYLLDVTNLIARQGDSVPKEIFSKCNSYEKSVVYKFLAVKDKQFADEWLDVRANIKYVHLKIRGEVLGRVIMRARIDCHIDMVQHINFHAICESTEKKTLVFTSFVEVLEKCMDVFPKQQLRGAFIYAKTNKDFNSIIKGYTENEAINPLVATFKSLSTAVPLIMADTMIIVDLPFRDYILQQTISRINRLGAESPGNIYLCTLDTGDEPNISGRSQEILEWSQRQIQLITGMTSPYNLEEAVLLEEGEMALEDYMERDINSNRKPSFADW